MEPAHWNPLILPLPGIDTDQETQIKETKIHHVMFTNKKKRVWFDLKNMLKLCVIHIVLFDNYGTTLNFT